MEMQEVDDRVGKDGSRDGATEMRGGEVRGDGEEVKERKGSRWKVRGWSRKVWILLLLGVAVVIGALVVVVVVVGLGRKK